MARNVNPKRLYRSRKTTMHGLNNDKNIENALVYIRNNPQLSSPTATTLIVGTNDLFRKSPETTLSEMKTLIGEIRDHLPDTTIVVSEIMPRPLHKAFNKKATSYNQQLRQYIAEKPNTKLMSQQTIWQTEGLFAPDRLHLTRTRGTAALVANLKAALNPLLGMSAYTRLSPRRTPTARPTQQQQHATPTDYYRNPSPAFQHRTTQPVEQRQPNEWNYRVPPRPWLPPIRPTPLLDYRYPPTFEPRDHVWPAWSGVRPYRLAHHERY